MAGEAALQKIKRLRTELSPANLERNPRACQSLNLGGGAAQPNVVRKLLRSLIRAKPHNLRFVSVKGAGTNKFSSCPGEQVKSKGASFQESAGSLLADAGYNPASRGLRSDPVEC